MNIKMLISLVLFTGMLAVVSCQKDNLVTDVPHNENPDFDWGKGEDVPIVSFFNFQGKIDSVLYVLQDTIGDYQNVVDDSGYATCDGASVFYGQMTTLFDTLTGRNALSIKLLDCIADTSDDVQKLSMLQVGTYAYGSSNPFATVKGVEVTWVDASGKVWTTYPGSGASNDDSFVIQAINPNPSTKNGAAMISGVMRVTLYNGTQVIKIENGQFNLLFGKL